MTRRYVIAKLRGVQEFYRAWTPEAGENQWTHDETRALRYLPADLPLLSPGEYLVSVEPGGALGEALTTAKLLETWEVHGCQQETR